MTAWPIRLACLFAAATVLVAGPGFAQSSRQSADEAFTFDNTSPAYAGDGPRLVFSAHNSEFVQNGLHLGLARLARGDGFRDAVGEGSLTSGLLADADILVLINPHVRSFRDFPAMEPPSAFSDQDIETVRQWVAQGGSLLVLADHAPFGGGASDLAAAFGFTFLNGHVAEAASARNGYARLQIDFTASDGLLGDHAITRGGLGREPIRHFQGLGGQAFIPADGAVSLLRIPDGWSAIFTYRIARELATAPRIDASGMSQGAVLDYDQGRIAVFGEAGGFNAQNRSDGRKSGFNTPRAADNPEFILSVLRWLARYQPPS